jgi:hypothetical protein
VTGLDVLTRADGFLARDAADAAVLETARAAIVPGGSKRARKKRFDRFCAAAERLDNQRANRVPECLALVRDLAAEVRALREVAAAKGAGS